MSQNTRSVKPSLIKWMVSTIVILGVIMIPLMLLMLVIVAVLGLPITLEQAGWANAFIVTSLTLYMYWRGIWRVKGKEEALLVSSILEQIEPDQLIKIKKFVVARKDNAYIVARLRTLGPRKGFYFLRFKRAHEVNVKEVHLPSISRREWGYSVMHGGEAIRGIPIVRFEGECAVPDSVTRQGKGKGAVRYVSGDCVGIFALRYYMVRSSGIVRRIDLTGEFDKESITELIGELSKQAET